MSMIKVLLIHPTSAKKSWKSDGTKTYCQGLCNMFIGDGDIKVLPVPRIPLSKLKVHNNMFNWHNLLSIIKENNPDIVHVNSYTSFMPAQALIAAHRLGKKIVYTAHWHPFCYLWHPYQGKIFFNLIMKPLINKYVDVITTINNEDTAFFESFFKEVVQIPHSIPKMSYEGRVVRRNAKMILFVGSVSAKHKGVEHLYSLPEGKYEIHCVGFGEMLSRSDITQHVGIEKEELDKLYSEASLVVVPSKYEAFSYVTLEALAHGTPVVISDRVRIADYLEDVRGYSIFTYGNYEEFCNMVDSTIGMEVDTRNVLQLFSQEEILKKYKSVYLSLVTNAKRKNESL